MVDTRFGRVIEDEPLLTDCYEGKLAAWTWADVNAGIAVIQLCPKFMEILERHRNIGVYVTSNILGLARAISFKPQPTDPTTIDHFCLLDCIILNSVCITAVSCTD